MLRKGIAMFLVIVFHIIFTSNLQAQDESIKPDDKKEIIESYNKESIQGIDEKTKQEIRGKITEISENGDYIKIGGEKIITSKQFLNDSFIAVGDNVAIMAEKTQDGIKAFDFKYIYEEGSDSSSLDEDSLKPVEFDLGISGE